LKEKGTWVLFAKRAFPEFVKMEVVSGGEKKVVLLY